MVPAPEPAAHDNFEVEVARGPDDPLGPVPQSFRHGTREIAVAEILDRWPGTDHLYIKLRGADGAVYILRQDLTRDRWQLVLFAAERSRRYTKSG